MANKDVRPGAKLVKSGCATGPDVDNLSPEIAFDQAADAARRNLKSFKVTHWQMLQAFQRLMDACTTPEEIERALRKFELALKT